MFTFYHFLELFGAFVGLILGGVIGAHHFGMAGGIGGAIAGGALGYLAGRLYTVVAILWTRLEFRRMSTPELRSFLRGPVWPAYHMAFAELSRRGEDVTREFDVVFDLLRDSDVVERIHGATILRLFFPDQAARVPEYDPEDSPDKCKEKLEKAGITSGCD